VARCRVLASFFDRLTGLLLLGCGVVQLIGLWVVHIGPNLMCYNKVKKNRGGAAAPTGHNVPSPLSLGQLQHLFF
jgi:hypothetical protein